MFLNIYYKVESDPILKNLKKQTDNIYKNLTFNFKMVLKLPKIFKMWQKLSKFSNFYYNSIYQLFLKQVTKR